MISVDTCDVDGKHYNEFDHFDSGVDGCAKCICLGDAVRCNAEQCLKYTKNQMESSTTLMKNTELRRTLTRPIHPQKKGSNSLSSDVKDYQEFTLRLLNRAIREEEERYAQNKTLSDLDDIKNQIATNYAYDDFKSFYSSPPCWSAIVYTAHYETISSYISKSIDAVVNDLFEKRFISTQEKLNKVVFHSSDTFVSNNSTLKQQANTISYSLSVTKTDTASVTITSEIRSKAEIKIPFFGTASLEFSISASGTQTQSQSVEYTITAPSQTIALDPKTKMNVTFHFYQYYDINTYFLDFVVDDSAMISLPNYRQDTYYGDPKCCEPCLLFKRDNTVFYPLNSFLRQNPDMLGRVYYENVTSVRLEEKDGKFILRNFPATEKIMNFGIDIIYGAPEPI